MSYRYQDVVYGLVPQTVDSAPFRSGLLAVNAGLRYTHPMRWASPYIGASFSIGAIIGTQDVGTDNPSLPAVYGDGLLRDDAESGVVLEAGLIRPLSRKTDLVLGFRFARMSSFSGDRGSPTSERHTLGARIGLRF